MLKEKGHENIAFVGGVASRVTISGEVVYDEQEIRAENYRQWMLLNKLEKFTTVLQGEMVTRDWFAFWSADRANESSPHSDRRCQRSYGCRGLQGTR